MTPYAQSFSNMGSLSTADFKMPNNSNIFGDLSKNALQSQGAMNSAQMGKQGSNNLQKALDAIYSDWSWASKPEKKQEVERLKDALAGEAAQYAESRGWESPATKKVFAGGWHDVLPSGEMRTEMSDIASGLSSGRIEQLLSFAKQSGAGAGKTQPAQKSISAPQAGTKEYYKRVIEGSMPGVGGLNEYQIGTHKFILGQ